MTKDPEINSIGATAEFPYDRMTVERFRAAFPRARWNDDLQAWFVPGTTASKRIGRWLAHEAAQSDAYVDAKGRDAYEFDPIASSYFEVTETGFRVRTPYSKTVVEQLREIPFASWDRDLRIWHVPFRSYEELRRRWKTIEAAARRYEPEEVRKRRETEKNTDKAREARARSAERRRRRYPVSMYDMPPPGRPVATILGLVVFTGTDGELADEETVTRFYPTIREEGLVWAKWRPARLEELVKTWPARSPASTEDRRRGWWQPTLDELRHARRAARSRERRRLAQQ
ncbi:MULTISPECIES: hypothetical protein [unclassified Sinorhizobium]|uniref:hypothetical protein n=1 Tax=unclassified Sinorhizobium TaxID=2613772 RepID=UPI0035250738